MPNYDTIQLMIKTTLVCCDLHIPHHNFKLLKTFIEFGKDIKPDNILILGDFLDCYSISKFDTKPCTADDFNEELLIGKEILSMFKKVSKEIIFIPGNHEERVSKTVMRGKLRALYNLDALHIKNLLEFNKLGIKYIERIFRFNKNFIAIHGTKCGAEPAKGEALSYMCSGISGHSHKCSVFKRSFLDKKISWWSLPCMCDIPKQDYAVSFSHSWDLGFALVKYNDKHQDVNIITSDENGKLYGF